MARAALIVMDLGRGRGKAGGERLGAPLPVACSLTHRFGETDVVTLRYVFDNVNRFRQWSGGRDATPSHPQPPDPADGCPPARAALIIMGAILPGQRDRPTRA